MKRTPVARANFIFHLVSSIAWMGAIAAFLALSLVGLRSLEADTVRSCYISMDLVGAYVIVPFSLAALVTGIVQSLITPWGLLRYYWVVAKLFLTIGATSLLMLHQYTAVSAAALRAKAGLPGLPRVGVLATQLVFDASAAILLLLAVTWIAVVKPWGRIWSASSRHGLLLTKGDNAARRGTMTTRALVVFAIALVVIVAAVHLTKGGHIHQ